MRAFLCLALVFVLPATGAEPLKKTAADVKERVGKEYPSLEALYKHLHANPELVRIEPGAFTPALVNDAKLTRRTTALFREVLGPERVHERPMSIGGEDFSRFVRRDSRVLLLPRFRSACSCRGSPAQQPTAAADAHGRLLPGPRADDSDRSADDEHGRAGPACEVSVTAMGMQRHPPSRHSDA